MEAIAGLRKKSNCTEKWNRAQASVHLRAMKNSSRASLPEACRSLDALGLFEALRANVGRYSAMSGEQKRVYRGFCSWRRRACVTLRIVAGMPYVLDLFPGFQSRHVATLHMVYRSLQRCGPPPDAELVIDVTDGELQHVDLPVLVITHRAWQPFGVLYPDFTFFSWPESACPPRETSHAYSHLVAQFSRNWTHATAPWGGSV